jgi:hypothetical protein
MMSRRFRPRLIGAKKLGIFRDQDQDHHHVVLEVEVGEEREEDIGGHLDEM